MPAKFADFHTIGQKYHHFKLVKMVDIPELQCQLLELIHEPTGAHVMHIANDDTENVFCLSFQTLPDSSNGVAHILEHTVLCGSKNFPVKDPFFAMQRRSLNTFMNALTGSDFTCYPAASQVPKDFYNLLDVYLDAVFYPNLNELSFLQEGHRLEFAIPTDSTSPLEFKGVVYNEMKGALASSGARLSEALNEALFPDITYGFNSGGDPKNIPDLSYEELKRFHKKYYHPSRCLFFFYGSMPLAGHLDFIGKKILNNVEKATPLSPLPLQPRFTQPKYIERQYPISADEDTKDQTLVTFGWLTCHILEQQELLALSILEIILLDTDASVLKKAFLQSDLCKQVSAYLEVEVSEIPLIITLRGCNPESADELERILFKTLKEVVYQGISLADIENAMHQLEFYRSEITGNHAPFGLSLFMRSGLLKQHGGLPESGLTIHSLFDELRRINAEDPTYFTRLITKHMIENKHFVRIVLLPSKELAAKELADEKATLTRIQNELSPEQTQRIIKKSLELDVFQKKQESIDQDVLPKVTLKDVPRQSRVYSLEEEKVGNLTVFHHSCFTNEIVYADLIFDLPDIVEEDLPYVRLFTMFLSQVGFGGRSYSENLEYLQANTGGVGASLTLNLQASDHHLFYPSLYLRGKALYRKVNKLFPILEEMASTAVFTDIPRLKQILLKHYTSLQSTLNQNSLRYAINLSASGLDVPSKIANAWYGLDYYWKIKELAQNFDQEAQNLVDKLEELRGKLLCLENPHLVLTCDADMYEIIKGHRFYGLQDIETKPYSPWKGNFPLVASRPHGRIIASPIAFTGKVLKTVSYVHPDSPALNIAAFLLDNLTLHTRLREQGGAYGGGAVSSAMSGNFYFYSYRDPNIVSTLESFNEAVKHLAEGHFDESDLEEAKLEMIQGLDAPAAPGSRGDLAYGWLREGKSQKVRQAFRDRILHLKKEDIIRAVRAQLLPNMDTAAAVVFAGKELLEKENAKLLAKGYSPLDLETV